ncbi:MAG: hypothetical protein KDB22_11355 [Planctomycetales bacterium]|nr:hypothetical protein [Planctomycetales bacterium]
MNHLINLPPNLKLASHFTLALVVCATLLQLPVPVLHSHLEIGSAGDLANHVVQYHDGRQDRPLDFHWHFAIPGDLDTDHHSSRHSNTPEAIPIVSLVDGIVSNSLSVGFYPPAISERSVATIAGRVPFVAGSDTRQHRLPWTPIGSMRAQLCVILC